jgi:2,4-dienoyl-CoA reductase-like NADH-dependent reductase (Old Yellow Enzyme family)
MSGRRNRQHYFETVNTSFPIPKHINRLQTEGLVEGIMFKHLFSPVEIRKGFTVKNRIFMAPITTKFASSSGYVTDRLINYYAERAKGGAGLIFVENCAIHPDGPLTANMLQVSDDCYLEGLERLAQATQQNDCKVVLQISHAGARAPLAATGKTPVAPSPVASPHYPTPRELDKEEIAFLVDCFGKAAARAKKAGFAGIDLHMASGYLVSQFLSPRTNRRSDDYGGDTQRRSRFAVEVLRKCREYVGSDYPIFCKLNASDYLDGGLEVEETTIIAQLLSENGLDALSLSGGMYESLWASTPAEHVPGGIHVENAAKIHRMLNIPVGVVGKISRPELAENILAEGKADFILMGRALLADPYLPAKALEEKVKDIRPCINCLECNVRLFSNNPVACTVNACAGQEASTVISPTPVPKQVLVVGGGPAGMEAARVASIRGHKVVLYERSDKLGGQLNLAARAPFNEHLFDLILYYQTQLEKFGVDIRLNKSFDFAGNHETEHYALVIAIGAKPKKDFIPGLTETNTITAWDLLYREPETGEKVVVLGGGLVGVAAAEYLIQKGKQVTMLEQLEDLNMHPVMKARRQLTQRLAKVDLLYQSRLLRVENGRMYVECNGLLQVFPEPDMFVLAIGAEPCSCDVDPISFEFVLRVGDCVEPRKIVHAIREGFQAGLEV